jgi:hypothetical protein
MNFTQPDVWPNLGNEGWNEACATLHLWTQIVGKVRSKLSPRVNHWWNSTLYVNSRGLTTSPIAYEGKVFEIQFDFMSHCLLITTSEGETRVMALTQRSVADFYQEFLIVMQSLGFSIHIDTRPQEIPNAIRFEEDRVHTTYRPEQAQLYWRALVQVDRVMKIFRSGFIGKCSPVHFFWGSFDLAVTRFSGRRAPERPGVDSVTREAYSHEVISVGFWPGSGNILGAAFYAYASPEPEGFSAGRIQPGKAFYNVPSHGYVLMYDEVRKAPNPDQMILDFFESTYELGADLGKWNRTELERKKPPVQRAA